MPETSGFGRVLVIGALAVVFGLAATSLVSAVLGDRWGGPVHSRHRGLSLAVGLGYLCVGLVVLLTFRSQLFG